MDMNHCVKPLPTLARNMPEPNCFTDYMQSLGVNRDSHLVLYDRGGMVSSARAWWMLRVHFNITYYGNICVSFKLKI